MAKFNVLKKKTISKYLFVYGVLLYPLINWVVFYVIGTSSSVLMAFQSTDQETFKTTWVGLDNFVRIIKDFSSEDGRLLGYMWNSIRYWVFTFVIGMPLNIFFGYMFVVKVRGTALFRFCLMLPSMISGMVTTMLIAKFAENIIPIFLEKYWNIQTLSLLRDDRFNFTTMIVMTLLTGFSFNVIIYSNAMKGSSESLFEAANLEGATHLQKLWHICMPALYQIMSASIVTSIPGILIGGPDLFMLYGYSPPENVMSVSFYIFQMSKNDNALVLDYSYATALSLMYSLVAFPITLLVNRLMEKMDPNND